MERKSLSLTQSGPRKEVGEGVTGLMEQRINTGRNTEGNTTPT
jgi:hypothetical protein